MTLSRVVQVLSNVAGNGHPAFFQTPDGKRWEVSKITNTRTVDERADNIDTVILLKEVK